MKDKAEKKKKKQEIIREIRRPIIFICNDCYSKTLRPLKEIALPVRIREADC